MRFATIDHHRGRARRQLATIRNLPPRAAAGLAVSERRSLRLHAEDRQPLRRALREDDRRLEAIGFAARSTSGRRVGSIGDRANCRTRDRRFSETGLYIAGPKIHSASLPCPTKGAPPFPRAAL